MAKEYDRNFSETVNALEALSHLYQKGVFKKERVEEMVRSLMAEMTDEQLDAYVEYQKGRERQAADQAEELKNVLGDLEAERNRRKK
jgi:hypothetical protein